MLTGNSVSTDFGISCAHWTGQATDAGPKWFWGGPATTNFNQLIDIRFRAD